MSLAILTQIHPRASWIKPNKPLHRKSPSRGWTFSMEVDREVNLYTYVDELIRWRQLLDNSYRQQQLNKRREEALYS